MRRFSADRVRCPDPTCNRLQRGRKWQGYAVDHCEACGQEYFTWALFGLVEVVGLFPGEAHTIDVTRPLATIVGQLGLAEAAA